MTHFQKQIVEGLRAEAADQDPKDKRLAELLRSAASIIEGLAEDLDVVERDADILVDMLTD